MEMVAHLLVMVIITFIFMLFYLFDEDSEVSKKISKVDYNILNDQRLVSYLEFDESYQSNLDKLDKREKLLQAVLDEYGDTASPQIMIMMNHVLSDKKKMQEKLESYEDCITHDLLLEREALISYKGLITFLQNLFGLFFVLLMITVIVMIS